MTTLKGLYKEALEAYSAAMTADERESAYNRMQDILSLMKEEAKVKKAELDIREQRAKTEKIKAETEKLQQDAEREKARLDIEKEKIEKQYMAELMKAPFQILSSLNPVGMITGLRGQNLNYGMFHEAMEYEEKGVIPNRTLDRYIIKH